MRIAPSTKLRALIEAGQFLTIPGVYDALGAKLAEQAGFEAVYSGGYVCGAATAISEPLMTMTEHIAMAGQAARAVGIPVVLDAGAGWGEPLHTIRTVREAIHAGIAGIQLEDQIYPKRAHYHASRAHEISPEEFADKVRFAVRERDRLDPAFVIIARTDSCREFGLEVAADRINRAADAGADLGLVFPRDMAETERAPKACRLPLVYVVSRGNRDGRPILSAAELKAMGYVAAIEAQLLMLAAFDVQQRTLAELRRAGTFTGLSNADCIRVRKAIEDTIGFDDYYEIERQTVERETVERQTVERGTVERR